MKTILGILSLLMMIVAVMAVNSDIKNKEKIKSLEGTIITLKDTINKLKVIPIAKDENKLLNAYQQCFLKLIQKDPACAKQFSKLMQEYE